MPFRSTSTPSIFTKAVYISFRELLDTIENYFDNVIVHIKYLRYYLIHLK